MSSNYMCIDLFSQMANLLGNFNGNLANSNPNQFSHDQGFISRSTHPSASEPFNYEQNLND